MKSVLMRHTPVNFISRCTALLCAVTWFVASNHCALAAMVDEFAKRGAPVAMQCEHCPDKGGSDGGSGAPMSGCCKGIKATTSMAGIPGFDAAFCGKLLCVAEMLMPPPGTVALPVLFADTGPPRFISFAEAVLSHSFQSHAPPIFG